MGPRPLSRFVPLLAALVLLLNLAACDVLGGNEPETAGDVVAANPPVVLTPDGDSTTVDPDGSTGPDKSQDDVFKDPGEAMGEPLEVRIETQGMTGRPGRSERVAVECVVRRGAELSGVEIWTAAGRIHHAVNGANGISMGDDPWTLYRYVFDITITSLDFVYVVCTNVDGVRMDRRVEFGADTPPTETELEGPAIHTNQGLYLPISARYYRPSFEIISYTNVRSARVENGVLRAEASANRGEYTVHLRVTNPFGSGMLYIRGSIHEPERLTTWANTPVELAFLDAEGITVHRMEVGEGVTDRFVDSTLVNAVHVKVTSPGGTHFSATRTFAYPDIGRKVVLNTYLVPMEPCRRFGEAWGRSLSECRDLLAETLFADGYTRYKHAPEAIVANPNPITGDLLPPKWEAMFEAVRAAMEERDMYLDRLPGSRFVYASQLKDQGGVMVPAESDRILVLPDAQATKPVLHFGTDSQGFTSGAVLTLPVSRFQDNFRLTLEDHLIRAWYPYDDSNLLAQLPSVQQRHFIETVIVPLRAAEDGVIGLSPGDRAEDVLIM